MYLGSPSVNKTVFICFLVGWGLHTLGECLQIQHLTFPTNYIQLTLVSLHVTCLQKKLN